MKLEEFLYQAAGSLRDGDYLLPETVLPAIEDYRELLEQMMDEVENDPAPSGLEPLDKATLEAYNSLLDALDMLELAVCESLPQLGSEILVRLQDAVETTREVRRVAQTHHAHIQEELGWQG